MSRSPKPGACQQGEAENQVAAGQTQGADLVINRQGDRQIVATYRPEAAAFEADPDMELYIKMRYWDDKAKEMNTPVSNIPQLKQMALQHLIMQAK